MKHGADTVMDDYEKNVFRPDEREHGSGPLGRDSMAFRDKMVKYHGEIERLVYAAEVLCDSVNGCDFSKDRDCPFAVNEFQCNLETIRETYGDHIEQHDIPQVRE